MDSLRNSCLKFRSHLRDYELLGYLHKFVAAIQNKKIQKDIFIYRYNNFLKMPPAK